MSADVLLFRMQTPESETLLAYYVLLSLHPEFKDATSHERTNAIHRIVAGFRQGVRGFHPTIEGDPALNRRAHAQALGLMEADRQATAQRVSNGGW